jgi:hypothetical protein
MLQQKLINLPHNRLLRKIITCSLITGILVSPIAGQAEDNPVMRLQQRSASKRFQQMKSQHQEWESTSKQEHVPQPADDWASAPHRVQRRTERQQSRTQRSDEMSPAIPHAVTSVPNTPPTVTPLVSQQPVTKPTAINTTANTAPKQELTSGVKQDELIPLASPGIIAESKSSKAQYDEWVLVNTTKKAASVKADAKPIIKPETTQAAELFEKPMFIQDEEDKNDKLRPIINPIPISTETVFPLFEPFHEAVPVPEVPLIEEEEVDKQITAEFPKLDVVKSVSMTSTYEPTPKPEPDTGIRNYTPNKIGDIAPFTDYQPADSIDPSNVEGSKLCEISNPDQACPPRNIMEPQGSLERYSPHCNKYWYASCITYNPLYFEDVTLERYGQEHHPLVQPFVSVGKFGGQLFGLPYQWVMHPPLEEVSPLGYYRPGEPAPEFLYQVPLNGEAALTTGAFYTGMIFLIP